MEFRCQIPSNFRWLREAERRVVKRSHLEEDAVGDSVSCQDKGVSVPGRKGRTAGELQGWGRASWEHLEHSAGNLFPFVNQHDLWLWVWIRLTGTPCSSHWGVDCHWGCYFLPEVRVGRPCLQPGKSSRGKREPGRTDAAKWWASTPPPSIYNQVVFAKTLFLFTQTLGQGSPSIKPGGWEAEREELAFNEQNHEEGSSNPASLIANGFIPELPFYSLFLFFLPANGFLLVLSNCK